MSSAVITSEKGYVGVSGRSISSLSKPYSVKLTWLKMYLEKIGKTKRSELDAVKTDLEYEKFPEILWVSLSRMN
jgi:hypothetical protein